MYQYIRHPLYASLILFTLGAGLKNPDLLSLVLVLAGGLFYYLTAKVEEDEMLVKFGDGYREYIKQPKMSSPFFFKLNWTQRRITNGRSNSISRLIIISIQAG